MFYIFKREDRKKSKRWTSQEITNDAADDDASSRRRRKEKRQTGRKQGIETFQYESVQESGGKRWTTYNEVADDLVKEFMAQNILANEQGRKIYDERISAVECTTL